jgi:hypothetical protein
MDSSSLSPSSTDYRARLRNKTTKWRENPERMAWIVILTSFAIFVFLAVTIPWAVRYTARYATFSQTARLSPIITTSGKLLLYPVGASEPIAVIEARDDIRDGMRIVTRDGAAQGALDLVANPNNEDLLGSVRIYSDSELEVLRIRRPVFETSPEPYRVHLRLVSGRARVISNSLKTNPLVVDLETPHGQVHLEAGSFQISVNDEETEVTVRSGVARLNQGRQALEVAAERSAWMNREGMSDVAASSEQNLLLNGTFSLSPVEDQWLPNFSQEVLFPGIVEFIKGDGRSIARFRQESANGHSEIGITQVISRNVQFYESLVLQMDVRILFQSLPGGGSMNSEYPVRVQINYTDIYGKDLSWGHGFYSRQPEAGEPFPQPPPESSDRVQQGQWYPYQSDNLIEVLNAQGTRPERINSIRIYASGHNYLSMVSEVYLLAR